MTFGGGILYIADSVNTRVRMVGLDGKILNFAGSTYGFAGDGGPATQAQMRAPKGLARGSDGTVYIADSNFSRIRAVGVDGNISTFAGNGDYGFSGDGGPATSAALGGVVAVAVAADGAVFAAESGTGRVRRIGLDGRISTVAGSGPFGYPGDGQPAISARLQSPSALAFGPDGSLYIADAGDHRVRRVDAAGMISTVAGSGTLGFGGDDGPATEAKLSSPQGIAIGSDGALYISDTGNNRVRRVELPTTNLSSQTIRSKAGQ